MNISWSHGLSHSRLVIGKHTVALRSEKRKVLRSAETQARPMFLHVPFTIQMQMQQVFMHTHISKDASKSVMSRIPQCK